MKRNLLLKILTCMLLVCAIASCLTACGDKENSQKIKYCLNNDGKSYAVAGVEQCLNTEIEIPTEYLGKPVTAIQSSAFKNNSTITSIYIPNSVTSIGNYAFENCTSLTSITIGENISNIGANAFFNCYRLVEVINKSTHITVEKGGTSNGHVGKYALAVYNSNDTFNGTKLSNDDGYIIYADDTENILVGYNGTANDLTLPTYITNINNYAMCGYTSLTNIAIGNNVTSIGLGAFYGCNSLTSITIPFVGEQKNSTHNSHFGYIFGTNTATFNYNHVPESLKTVIITGGSSITSSAFSDCNSLTSIVISDSITSIGNFAFSQCDSLLSITIPNSVTNLGLSAFYNCLSLERVVIGDGVINIDSSTFSNCYSLKSVVIGNSVNSIGLFAFSRCGSLTDITYNGTIAEWNAIEKVYDWNTNVPATEIVCSDGVVDI